MVQSLIRCRSFTEAAADVLWWNLEVGEFHHGKSNPPGILVYNGSKPYEQMDDLGVPLFLETPIYKYTLGILAHRTEPENGILEAKLNAFRFGEPVHPNHSLTFGDWIPRVRVPPPLNSG